MQVIDSEEDATELQHSLDNLCEWARTWGMAFNEAKCHMMHVGLHNPGHVYTMNGIRLETSDKEWDIGVTTSSNLKPAQQCKKAALTASTVLAQITRTFHYGDRHVFLSLYQQYVPPHLEFAVHGNQADIQCLEAVQQRAVRAISGLWATTYEKKVKELKMPSLQDDGGRLNEANKEQCCEAQLNAEKGKPQVQKTVFQLKSGGEMELPTHRG